MSDNRFRKISDESLLKAIAHINVDPCDPSQDAMYEALSEVVRRYKMLLKQAGASKRVTESVDEAIANAANDGSLNSIMFERCRDLEGRKEAQS